ncbi:hypothetical protein FOXG_08524 [Fusarium oxysporum f. sp. lycopersici 4287]|uniref:Uncharacterized protein n=2 Tax=Fusarium oxysporum TaxID=5507 RepID=A0A0J9V832_FUSO4|nr:hypothetical protein FOXG_08524 [Fusarium oxysporum f. sp. lycopersici 4287]KNB07313.1 hypothetical protein FOXG_08524 [Fusarium oxysporum f. sp. lycopersici 4287]
MFPLMRCDLEDPIHRRCIAAAIAKDEDHADYLRHGVVELGSHLRWGSTQLLDPRAHHDCKSGTQPGGLYASTSCSNDSRTSPAHCADHYTYQLYFSRLL